MTRLDDIEKRVDNAFNKEVETFNLINQRVMLLMYAESDFRALVAVARAAELVRIATTRDSQQPPVKFEIYEAYKLLFAALDALQAGEGANA